ncbi:hypothetical protein [Pseudomonas sp. S2_H01]
MSLEVQGEPVTGGYRIIDTDRHEGYQGVATVTQRDAHPMVYDCLISHDEALERAKLMAAAPELLEALQELRALMQGVIDGEYDPDFATLQIADAAIAKATS